MDFKHFTTSDWIAVIGGIIGILGGIAGIISLIISIFTAIATWKMYKRDQGVLDAKLTSALLSTPPFIDLHLFTVANKGRRTITVSNVGLQFLKKEGWSILNDNQISWGKKDIEEGKNLQYAIKKAEINIKEYSHIKVIDETGKIYLFPIAPRYKRFFYELLHKTHIKRKPSFFKK